MQAGWIFHIKSIKQPGNPTTLLRAVVFIKEPRSTSIIFSPNKNHKCTFVRTRGSLSLNNTDSVTTEIKAPAAF